MGEFDKYQDKSQDKQELFSLEKTKGLGIDQDKENIPMSGDELIDKYENRIRHTSSFEERTRYYFEDYKLMDAKAERYRRLGRGGEALDKFASAHTNHGARKRKKYANDAAGYFEEASKLTLSLDMEKTKGFALFRHREKIMRLRMKAMASAAMAKSKSAEDEAYRIAKSKFLCLKILKNQLDVLSQDDKLTEAEILKFRQAEVKLEREYETAKADLLQKAPSPAAEWEKVNNLTNIDQVLETLNNQNQNMENVHPYRVVLKDRNGMPLNNREKQKDEWNQKWRNAAEKSDKTEKNAMLAETYERVTRWPMPSPDEIRKNGIVNLFLKNPAQFHEMLHLGKTLEFMKDTDEFVKNYCAGHPEFEHKAAMLKQLGKLFENRLAAGKNKQQDGQDLNVEFGTYLGIYSENYSISPNQLTISHKKDMQEAELHTDNAFDVRKEVIGKISDLRDKLKKNDTLSPELMALDYSMRLLNKSLNSKLTLVDTGNKDESFDYRILMIQSMYNEISSKVDSCLKKSKSYGSLKHGKLLLQKLKVQCKAEAGAFRNAALEYKKAIEKGSITFPEGQVPLWRDVLGYTRSVVYDLDKKGEGEFGTKKSHGGQTEVLFIDSKEIEGIKQENKDIMDVLHGEKQDNVHVVFIKEDIRKASADEILEDAVKGLKLEDIEDEKVLEVLKKEVLTALKKDKAVNGEESFKRFMLKMHNGTADFLLTVSNDMKIKAGQPVDEDVEATGMNNIVGLYLSDKYQNDMDVKFAIAEAVMKIGRAFFHDGMLADEAEIKKGRSVTNRNIATSRLATLLQINDMVCDTRSAYIKKDGKLIKGVAMDNSRGLTGDALVSKAAKEKKHIRYSDNAINQLYTMNIFDALCGQVDRNHNNFHLTYEVEDNTYVVTGIKCLDNDMCFGSILEELKTGKNRMQPVNKQNIRGLPISVLNRFMNITPAFMNNVLGDLLEKDELDYLGKRLNIIKDVVREMEKDGELEIYDNKYRYKNEEMRDDKLRQLTVLKKMQEEADQNRNEKKRNQYGMDLGTIENFSGFNEIIVKGGNRDTDIATKIENEISLRKIQIAIEKKNAEISEKDKQFERIQKNLQKREESYNRRMQEQNKNNADKVDVKQVEKKEEKKEVRSYVPKVLEPLPVFKNSIMPEIKYERQGTCNCFACSGTAILNQFLLNEGKKKGQKFDPKKQFGQLDLRDYKISNYKSFEEVKELAQDKEEYDSYLNDIKSRVGLNSTSVNNIMELGDFFLEKDKDICVNRMVFKMPNYSENMSPERIQAFDEERQRMKSVFLTKVNEVIETGNFVSILHKGHYMTITGIDGENLEVLDSIKSEEDTRDVTKPIKKTVSELMETFDRDGVYDNAGNLSEITWLSKVKEPQEYTNEFSNLQYDENNGYSLKEHSMDEVLFLGQTKGVMASREESNEIAGGGIEYSVYISKMDQQSRNAPQPAIKPIYGQKDYATVMKKMG